MNASSPGEDSADDKQPAPNASGIGSSGAGAGPGGPGGTPSAPLAIRSEELLQGRGEVRILHNGEQYRLTVTRSGKLILHK